MYMLYTVWCRTFHLEACSIRIRLRVRKMTPNVSQTHGGNVQLSPDIMFGVATPHNPVRKSIRPTDPVRIAAPRIRVLVCGAQQLVRLAARRREAS